MSMTLKTMAVSVVAAVTVSFASMGVDAGGPVALTERQLDNVTAGQGGPGSPSLPRPLPASA